MEWGPAPPSLPKGAQLALLAGDPAKPGPFALRVRFPPNSVVAPHWHATDENLTVLDGDTDVVERSIESGIPFLTNGCPGAGGEPGCTRPYGSYRPSEPFRDFPFLPDPNDLAGIRSDLALHELKH